MTTGLPIEFFVKNLNRKEVLILIENEQFVCTNVVPSSEFPGFINIGKICDSSKLSQSSLRNVLIPTCKIDAIIPYQDPIAIENK
jgi:hypothetical protein